MGKIAVKNLTVVSHENGNDTQPGPHRGWLEIEIRNVVAGPLSASSDESPI